MYHVKHNIHCMNGKKEKRIRADDKQWKWKTSNIIYILLKKNERMKRKIASEKFYCKTISPDVWACSKRASKMVYGTTYYKLTHAVCATMKTTNNAVFNEVFFLVVVVLFFSSLFHFLFVSSFKGIIYITSVCAIFPFILSNGKDFKVMLNKRPITQQKWKRMKRLNKKLNRFIVFMCVYMFPVNCVVLSSAYHL